LDTWILTCNSNQYTLACTMARFSRSTGRKWARSHLHNVINSEISRAEAYSTRVVHLEIDQSSVGVATTLPSKNPDFALYMEDDDKQPSAPVYFTEEEEVVESDVDDDSLSDDVVDEDDLTKEQATILFRGAVVIDDESTSEEVEEVEDYVYYAADEIDELVEVDVHEREMLNLLEIAKMPVPPLIFLTTSFQTS
jgi:hypothetical protein